MATDWEIVFKNSFKTMKRKKQETIFKSMSHFIWSLDRWQIDVIITFWDTLFPLLIWKTIRFSHSFFTLVNQPKIKCSILFPFGSAFFKFFGWWFSYAIITGIEIHSNRKNSIILLFSFHRTSKCLS